MSEITGTAFITTRKGFCYLTIKIDRKNYPMMRIRQYKIEPDEKRQMRRLYPNVTFDWKKIAAQLAVKREVCRDYRNAWRTPRPRRRREPFYGVIDHGSRTVYASDPSDVAGCAALLDALLAGERE